jgi:23S rRNA pseudouridine1911/1915/1917 synthase
MPAFVVSPAAHGCRLDAFVAEAMRGAGPSPSQGIGTEAPSRGDVQRWIADGRVTVARVAQGAALAAARAARAADKVREGDVVDVVPAGMRKTEARAEEGIAFEVLYADEAVVVVNKPAGLVVHPARGHAGGTLVNGLLARGYFDASAGSGGLADPRDLEGFLRPGIVHRIDKGTSGILIVARTAQAREGLKEQFAAHTIERAYDALALGDVTQTHHDTLHGRHPRDRLRFTTHVREGRHAVTDVKVLERFGGRATYVRCRLETGRTHQIRVHLAESGTPILGDALYGRPVQDAKVRALAVTLGHQALHARVLGFVHPVTGETLRFEAPLPEDFSRALEGLRCVE